MKKFLLYLFALWAYVIVTWLTTDFLLRPLASHKEIAYLGGFAAGSAIVGWLAACAAGKTKSQDNLASAMWVVSLLNALGYVVADALRLTVSAQAAFAFVGIDILFHIVAAAVYLRLGYSPTQSTN